MKFHPLLACTLLFPTLVSADDFTVEEKPFKTETTLQAVFLPTQSQEIRIKPEIWSAFSITSLVPQGSMVKKGDTLIGIDAKKLDKHIAKTEKARAAAALTLAQTKYDLAQLEITTPRSLETAARTEKETTENLKWYTEIGQPKDIAATKNAVLKAEQTLSYTEEELKQLLKMYNEDDKIEETEEIILTRTRNSIAHTKLALESIRINAEKSLKTEIPRKLLSYQLSAKNAQIANTAAKENLPRALEQKRLAVALAVKNDKIAVENIAKLKSDRAMMNITSPSDGLVYYGSIKAGKWNPAAATKVLNIGAKLPASTTVMTIIPTDTPLELSAFTEEANLSALKKDSSGYAITLLNRYQSLPVKLTNLSTCPETDGKFHVTLQPTLSKDLPVVPGMKATVKISGKTLPKALKVPTAYITRADDSGYTVKVKLADGKTETRKVDIGLSNKDWAVITKGLEKGQVIVK